MSVERTEELLRECGAVLVRKGNHLVYKLPNGQLFTRPKTPNDYRGERNNYQMLRKLLGLSRVGKVQEPNPKKAERHKKNKARKTDYRIPPFEPVPTVSFGRKLLEAGYTPPPPEEQQVHKHREPKPKEKCISYPPEVLKEATRILAEQGPQAYNNFLKQHREQAVEVTATRRKKETPLQIVQPSMEVRVSLARKHAAQLREDNLAADKRIEAARKAIEADQALQAANIQTMTRLTQFVDAFDLVIEESNKIDSVLTPLEQMMVRQEDQKTKRATTPLPYEQILAKGMPLLGTQKGTTIAELFEFLRPKVPNLEKKHVTCAIQAEFLKHECRISRLGHGKGTRYVISSTAVVNGHAAAHRVAGAA